jgi:CP family cyanate transporter-like MFS transporter
MVAAVPGQPNVELEADVSTPEYARPHHFLPVGLHGKSAVGTPRSLRRLPCPEPSGAVRNVVSTHPTDHLADRRPDNPTPTHRPGGSLVRDERQSAGRPSTSVATSRVTRPTTAVSIAILVAVPLLALNLRPAVTSLGSVLVDVQANIGMSAALAATVVAAPVWCFAAGGALAWALRVRYGTARTVTCALLALMVSLAGRVVAGPYLLLAGTVASCLAIAVLGTLLPAIVHAAPAGQWTILTGCYVAALGSGSAVGALFTPKLSAHTSWQVAASSWALLAGAGWLIWRVAARRLAEQPVAAARRRTSPMTLRPATTAWSLTVHFGLTSGATFSVMGWLPSILLDRAAVPSTSVGWLFALAMGLGVPFALRVPRWARRGASQSGLAVVLAAPSIIGTAGLLAVPTVTPWVWATCLGLGMPAVGLALAAISLRADAATDTAAALSSMVQGFGYALAGAVALGTGLLHSATQGWHWPLITLLVVLCGQAITGVMAGRPVTIHTGIPAIPAPRSPHE